MRTFAVGDLVAGDTDAGRFYGVIMEVPSRPEGYYKVRWDNGEESALTWGSLHADEPYHADYRTVYVSDIYNVQDGAGQQLVVGTRVKIDAWAEYPEARGYVTAISDLDGDTDDEGRSFAILPRVTVKFDDGEEETFSTTTGRCTWADYPDGSCDFIVDDIDVVKEEEDA